MSVSIYRHGLRVALLLPFTLAGCGAVDDPSVRVQHDPDLPAPVLRSTSFNPERNLYWGDTHVHSSLSYDAFSMGVRAGPDDAWRYMKGETIEHGGGYTIRAGRPLDFGAVTDHAEYLGVAEHLAGDDADQNPVRDAIQSGSVLKMNWEFARIAILNPTSRTINS